MNSNPSNMIPGLEDLNIEFFVNEQNELKVIHNGKCTDFKDLDDRVVDNLFVIMYKDKVAYKSIIEDLNISDPISQIEQYIRCCCPVINTTPDLDLSNAFKKEVWDCPLRDTCKSNGKVCAYIAGPNGTLTPKETKVYFLTCRGLFDKEIAEATGCTVNTIDVHQRSIRHKLSLNNRVECILHAVKAGIKV